MWCHQWAMSMNASCKTPGKNKVTKWKTDSCLLSAATLTYTMLVSSRGPEDGGGRAASPRGPGRDCPLQPRRAGGLPAGWEGFSHWETAGSGAAGGGEMPSLTWVPATHGPWTSGRLQRWHGQGTCGHFLLLLLIFIFCHDPCCVYTSTGLKWHKKFKDHRSSCHFGTRTDQVEPTETVPAVCTLNILFILISLIIVMILCLVVIIGNAQGITFSELFLALMRPHTVVM